MKRLCFIVSLISAGLLAFKIYNIHKHGQIQAALAYGRLASLPNQAKVLNIDTEGCLFSRTFWLVFKASSNDIENWMQQSPSLHSHKSNDRISTEKCAKDAPNWFKPSDIKGYRFDIPQNREALYGTVWVDTVTHIVYIQTSHS